MAINSPDDPLADQYRGNYRLLRRIGGGGIGEVYEGKHLYLDRPNVAIKLLKIPLPSQEECEAFMEEARFLQRLEHPHILRIIDAGFHSGHPYLVTEFASGGSLKQRLQNYNNSRLSLDEVLTVLKQIGDALSHAHLHNVVHRDLKPDNILFNGKGEALLADFGLAVWPSVSSNAMRRPSPLTSTLPLLTATT